MSSAKKHFLYLRGHPGVGKITIARLLEKELGWKVFWFHDLKNAVYNIVKEHRIPRLMDELTAPVARFLLERGENVIYVRPSPDRETVENVQQLLADRPDYSMIVVRLEASYDTLLTRVLERNDPYRITSKADLDDYVNNRTIADIEGEYILPTDTLTPDQIVEQIRDIIRKR